MKTILEKTLCKALLKIANSQDDSIEVAVVKEALADRNPTSFFEYLFRYGCINGAVQSLIFYTSTHTFYDTYYDEIEEIRQDFEENIGQPIKIQGDYKNFMTWFAFEQTAYKLCNEIGLDI